MDLQQRIHRHGGWKRRCHRCGRGAAEITVQISLSGVVLDSAVRTVTVTASSSSGGSGGGSSTYAVSVESTSNGTVSVSPRNASRGDTVTVTVKPDSGYELMPSLSPTKTAAP